MEFEEIEEKQKNEENKSKEKIPLDIYNLFWICIIASVIGVIIETLYCYITRGFFESRTGLIYGPFNLVYGFGAVLITVLLYYISEKKKKYIFFGGMVIGALFEFACSIFQEISFGTISWRYDEGLFNFQGRINLMYSIFWGILATLWFKYILNHILEFLSKIPKKLYKILTITMFVFMVFNSYISYMAVDRMSKRRHDVNQYTKMDKFLDKHYTDEKIKKVYPNMWYVN